MTKNKGFTLIEILIVIVIIGITAGFALIAFGDFGADKKILFAAEQLESTLKLAQQQAILETSTLGLRIDNGSYQILKFQDAWRPIANKGIFKVHYFPKNTRITLKTAIKAPLNTPSIVINPSGDMTAFNLNFATETGPIIAVLAGSQNGDLNLNRVPNK